MKSNSFSLFDFNPDSRKNASKTITKKQHTHHRNIIPIPPRIGNFQRTLAAQLRNRIEPTKGIFIAESPKVISVAIDAGYKPLALLCEQKHITGDAATIIGRSGDIPVYTGTRELLATLTGYTDPRRPLRHASSHATQP